MINNYRYGLGQFQQRFTVITLTGGDVDSFLQSQSTFDISQLEVGHFHLASFLDPQGRLEVYGWLVKRDKDYLYLVPELLGERAVERLNRFLISEDVTLSEPQQRIFCVFIGAQSHMQTGYKGELFADLATISENVSDHAPSLTPEEIETWRGLSGWPTLDGSCFKNELINNSRLFDLSVVMNKGCYPGQETVSKIATRRGAAYSPVLLETQRELSKGAVTNFDKRIGQIIGCYRWEGKFYASAELLRDFRVQGLKLSVEVNGESETAIVRYFPLFSGKNQDKALELYYRASDHFRDNDLISAERDFRLAIELDPYLGDAYESLGVMLGRLERYQEALELMQKLSEVDPTSVLAHTNMSLFLMKMGKIEEAEEQKSQATIKSFQKFGQEAQEKEKLAQQVKEQQSEWAKRESMFLQVLEIDPEDTLANFGLGTIAVEKSDWQKAREHLETVLQADPKYSAAYLALGRALAGLGEKDEARRIWEEGIKVAASKGDLMPANQMQSELERL